MPQFCNSTTLCLHWLPEVIGYRTLPATADGGYLVYWIQFHLTPPACLTRHTTYRILPGAFQIRDERRKEEEEEKRRRREEREEKERKSVGLQ